MEGCYQAGEAVRKMNKAIPSVSHGVHLNLGCGAKTWNGFVNIDFPSNWSGRKPDIECDLHSIPLPDNHADSAYAIHVLEHFYRYETEDVLKEWVRLLKPCGQLIIEVPCLDKVIKAFVHFMSTRKELNKQATLHRLYGDPAYKDPTMVHKWCFSTAELVNLMEEIGLKDVTASEPEFHHPQCDMRVTGIK